MSRDNNKTVTYNYDDEFFVDVVYTESSIDLWLYKEGIGIKSFMFGLIEPRPDNEDELIHIIIDNIEDYIDYYIEDYLNEDA